MIPGILFRFNRYCRVVLTVITLTTVYSGVSSAQSQLLSKIPGANPKEAFDKAIDQQVGKILGEELPLTLNAQHAYPTISDAELPGGSFKGKPLTLTRDALLKPLPPGDYTLPMTFFCSEYGQHQSGGGIAYVLAPAEGKLSTPIATLLWRGMMVGKTPQELQMISWAIQSSIPYSKMPTQYQKTIDQLLPDFKSQLNGQGFAQVKTNYDSFVTGNLAKFNKAGTTLSVVTLGRVKVPPIQAPALDTVLARMGPMGHLALDAEKQATLISGNYVSEEKRQQTVFAGQGTQLPPQPAVNGPWSLKAPGIYMRFVVKGGNLTGTNEMQIRIVQSMDIADGRFGSKPHLQLASFQVSAASALSPSLIRILGGVVNEAAFAACVAGTEGIGTPLCEALATTLDAAMTSYAIGVGAQAPIMIPSALANIGHEDGNGGAGKKETTAKNPTGVDYPGSDPNKAPGPGYQWRGNGAPSSGKGNWVNGGTGEQLHPDLNHPDPLGPHWDYTDPSGKQWRLFPDGSAKPK